MANQSKSSQQERRIRPPQHQNHQPGREAPLRPAPESENSALAGGGKLTGRVALITGGDSGIGRAVALAFAREGAHVAVLYLEESEDARETRDRVEEKGRRCLLIEADVSRREECQKAIQEVIERFGRLDILVNNAAEQHPCESLEDLEEAKLEKTFRTNVFGMFFLTACALPHLKRSEHGTIINTSSVTAYRGSPALVDYAASKAAIVGFTRSLASQLVDKHVRVNAVAPGPIWTPLIAATFPAEKVATFGSDSPMGRAGEPWECAECYVFLASEASSYMTGQALHPNGGEIING